MKNKNIVSYTGEQLEQMPSDTDWKRVQVLTGADIERLAQEDPDSPPLTSQQLENAVLVVPDDDGKEQIALWIDKDVLRYFGKGTQECQTRLNTVLRKMMVAELVYGKNIAL